MKIIFGASWVTLYIELAEDHVELARGGGDGPHTGHVIGVAMGVVWGLKCQGPALISN